MKPLKHKKNTSYFLQRLSSFLLLSLLFLSYSIGKPSVSEFDILTTEQGLSSNYSTCVVEDKNGFLWIGTSQGLDRYDGKNFKEFVHNTEEKGSLSDSHISCLLKDSYGDLWVGTMKGGLCKYNNDGTFDCFQHEKNNDQSISDNQIWSIYEDSKNRLWIGTQNGLNLLDRQTNSFIRFLPNPEDSTSLPAQAVLSFLEDDMGRLWIGTWDKGIALFQPSPSGNIAASTFLPLNLTLDKQLGKNNIWTMEIDHQGRIWIGVRNSGLFLCEPTDCTLADCSSKDFQFHEVLASELFDQSIILDLNVDQKNKLWIGSSMGIFQVDLSLSNAVQKNIAEGKMEVQYKKMGTPAQNAFINNIYKDQKGIIWFATKRGLHKYANYLKKIPSKTNLSKKQIPNNFNSFYQDVHHPDWIWTAQSNEGLVAYSVLKDRFISIKTEKGEKFKIKNISSIYQEQSSELWIGTNKGRLISLQMDSNTVVRHEEINIPSLVNEQTTIWNITKDQQDRLIISTHRGLYLYHPPSKKMTIYSEYDDNKTTIIGHNVFDAIQDQQGTYWIATAGGGLNTLQYKQEIPYFKQFLPSEKIRSIKSNIIYDLHLTGNNLWIASQTGIQAYDVLQERFLANPILDKAITGQVLGITSDQVGNIWFITDDGLYLYNIKKQYLSLYNQTDGVIPGICLHSIYTNNEGRLFIGGLNGFNPITPSKLPALSFSNELLITDIKVYNKSIPIGVEEETLGKPILTKPIWLTEQIELSYQQDFITFEFSTLDYLNPNRYSYAYQLEGLDEDWIEAGTENAVTYTNLNPNTYTFKVKAKNHLGIWSAPQELKMKIHAPFWQTIPFILFSIIGGIALLWFWQNRRENQIKKNNEILEQKVSDRTQALKKSVQESQQKEQALFAKNQQLEAYIESNKQLENFASIASHDLQAPLRTIKSFTGLLEKSLGDKMNSREKEFTGYIKTSTSNMQDLVQALLTFSRINSQKRKLEDINPMELLKSVQTDLTVTIEEEKAILTIGELPPSIKCDKIKLKQLLQNLISNGIKFSKKDLAPEVHVNCEELPEHWQFEVTDNGIGISKEYNDKIFQLFQRLHTVSEYEGTGIGLSLCKKLVEQHDGEIWVESEQGEGSQFYFTISKHLSN